MTKIQMPEPSLTVTIVGYNPSTKGRRYSGALTHNEAPNGRFDLFTFDQMEAYAEAQVRQALEEAAQICDDEAREWDSDGVITEKSYAECCAKRIRALIPATK